MRLTLYAESFGEKLMLREKKHLFLTWQGPINAS